MSRPSALVFGGAALGVGLVTTFSLYLRVGPSPAPPAPRPNPQVVEPPKPHRLRAPIRDAIARGSAFLLTNRSGDGLWKPDNYATFRDGTALSPLVAIALLESDPSPETAAARRTVAETLARYATADGTIAEPAGGFPYPYYTAPLAIQILSHPENQAHVAARDAWLGYLLARQLTEANGWSPDDKPYGGWGYYPFVPKKPADGELIPAQQLLESNLSATLFALDALRDAAATLPADDPVRSRLRKAALPAWEFVRRRQNFPRVPAETETKFDDGGFSFVHDDPVRNKAGIAGTDSRGRTRFHSYGSTTADGLRALNAAGQLTGNSRQGYEASEHAARDWLVRNFDPASHPGKYVGPHEPNRDAVYFYYAASAARAFRVAKVTEAGGKPWAETLAAALLAKQKPDGSWANDVALVRENEPVLATAYAIRTLADCRAALPP